MIGYLKRHLFIIMMRVVIVLIWLSYDIIFAQGMLDKHNSLTNETAHATNNIANKNLVHWAHNFSACTGFYGSGNILNNFSMGQSSPLAIQQSKNYVNYTGFFPCLLAPLENALKGKIIYAMQDSTLKPVGNALVHLCLNNQIIDSCYSDQQGLFKFNNLNNGLVYRLDLSKRDDYVHCVS